LKQLSAVLITNTDGVSEEVVGRARSEGVKIFSTTAGGFEVVGRLYQMGCREARGRMRQPVRS
jgi:hypothetical protein